MKTYIQTEDGFIFDSMSIPDAGGNRHYRKMIDEVESGEAEIIPYIPPVIPREELRRAEYPSIEERLDDLFDKGAFSPEMTTQIQAINDRHQ